MLANLELIHSQSYYLAPTYIILNFFLHTHIHICTNYTDACVHTHTQAHKTRSLVLTDSRYRQEQKKYIYICARTNDQTLQVYGEKERERGKWKKWKRGKERERKRARCEERGSERCSGGGAVQWQENRGGGGDSQTFLSTSKTPCTGAGRRTRADIGRRIGTREMRYHW